jgi:hypothetical protein
VRLEPLEHPKRAVPQVSKLASIPRLHLVHIEPHTPPWHDVLIAVPVVVEFEPGRTRDHKGPKCFALWTSNLGATSVDSDPLQIVAALVPGYYRQLVAGRRTLQALATIIVFRTTRRMRA